MIYKLNIFHEFELTASISSFFEAFGVPISRHSNEFVFFSSERGWVDAILQLLHIKLGVVFWKSVQSQGSSCNITVTVLGTVVEIEVQIHAVVILPQILIGV